MATKADLRLRVLRRLRVIDHTQAPAAEQTEVCDLHIDDARAELLERGLCWWDENDIPDAVMSALMIYVVALAAASFGKAGKGLDGPAVEDRALKRIRALKSGAERPVVRSLYY